MTKALLSDRQDDLVKQPAAKNPVPVSSPHWLSLDWNYSVVTSGSHRRCYELMYEVWQTSWYSDERGTYSVIGHFLLFLSIAAMWK